MRKLTFEYVLAYYLALAVFLAIAIPKHFAIESYAAINPAYIPFAAWLRLVPGAMPYLTTYFFTLTLLIPVLIFLLARYPQDQNKFTYQVPTLWRCIGATLLSVSITAALVVFSVYAESSSSGSVSSRGFIIYAAATSPLALAVAGPLLMGTFALMLYFLIVKVPRMWLGLKAGTFG